METGQNTRELSRVGQLQNLLRGHLLGWQLSSVSVAALLWNQWQAWPGIRKQRISVAHHQLDIFIMEPGSDRYLGRLCSYNQCPKGKPECRVTDCGSTPLLRQYEDFKLHTSALMPGKSTVLI
jgi:hypothetical protein